MISAQTLCVCREENRCTFRIMLLGRLRINLNSSPRLKMTPDSAAKNRGVRILSSRHRAISAMQGAR
jgi:hypothetical protein